MVTKRYLLYFSYIGTYFRGVQRQMRRDCHDPSTVQGLIEFAAEKMKPNRKPTTLLASRTDQGVHALMSALTIDLDFAVERKPIQIHKFLNSFFHDTEIPIRINEVLWVPWDFNCREAPLWRRYVYRFAVVKPNIIPANEINQYTLPIPISEHNRCYFVTDPNFDYEAMKKAAELFIGVKDYVAFLGKPHKVLADEALSTVRCLHRVIVEPAAPYIPLPMDDCFDYYHLTCEGKSFIYNQVRKTVAILLAVAQRKLVVDDVAQMFINPSPANWPKFVLTAPADALYLTEVFYDPKDLALPDDIKDSVKNPKPATPAEEDEWKRYEEELRLEIAKAKSERYSD